MSTVSLCGHSCNSLPLIAGYTLPLATTAADPAWCFEIGAPVARVAGSTLEADLEQLLRVTERQVLQAPQLWSWHHRR